MINNFYTIYKTRQLSTKRAIKSAIVNEHKVYVFDKLTLD